MCITDQPVKRPEFMKQATTKREERSSIIQPNPNNLGNYIAKSLT